MSSELHWESVPSVGGTLLRADVLGSIERSRQPLVLLSAPSGYGKSVVAAQLAGRVSTAEWHESADAPLLIAAARERLASGSDGPPVYDHGNLVVIDDCGLDWHERVEGCLADLVELSAISGKRVLVTTRVRASDVFDSPREMAQYDQFDLALTLEEVMALAGGTEKALGKRVLDMFQGHVELTCLYLDHGLRVDGSERDHPPILRAAVGRVLDALVFDEEWPLFLLASVLEEGELQQLEQVLGGAVRPRARGLSERLPIFSLAPETRDRSPHFAVQTLVATAAIERKARDATQLAEAVTSALSVLAEARRWARAAEVLIRHGEADCRLAFLARHGQQLIDDGHPDEYLDLVNSIPLSLAMSEPKVFLYWACALDEVDDHEQAAAKASACVKLAGHAGDHETLARASIHVAVMRQEEGRLFEAVEQLGKLFPEPFARLKRETQCDVLISYGNRLGMADRIDEARKAFDDAGKIVGADTSSEQSAALVRARAYSLSVCEGDWVAGLRCLAPLIEGQPNGLLSSQQLAGNAAWMLMEAGRRDRSRAIANSLDHSIPSVATAYGSIDALLRASEGDLSGAVAQLEAANSGLRDLHSRHDRLMNLAYLSSIKRANGLLEESLADAEAAYEGLLHTDIGGQARVAAVEVAASLTALGDLSAAAHWLSASDVEWDTVNNSHLLYRHSVGLVVAARKHEAAAFEPMPDELAANLLAGNANWRLAMYSAAFPELLGLLAMQVGAEHLPNHLLRCVPPTQTPAALAAARPILSDAEWHILGERALGKEQFEEYLERAGKPICRVRLFGGLEVVADGRHVVEKDWKKRKARVLFAMLALNAGQDISRDVIFDHLWPDLTEEKAKNNFYVVWSTMKSALMGPNNDGPCPYIESRRGRCKVVKEAVRTDVDEVDSLLQRIRQADAEGRTGESITALQELMSLYRGDLLPGDLYDDWFSAPRERYRFEFIDMMLRGAELLMEKDDPYEALVFARRALMMDPFREDIYQVVLRCQILAGQRSAAIETFVQCKAQLAEELGLDPTAETQALYQQILAMEEKPRYDTYRLTDDDK